jgi:hypothetical protein
MTVDASGGQVQSQVLRRCLLVSTNSAEDAFALEPNYNGAAAGGETREGTRGRHELFALQKTMLPDVDGCSRNTAAAGGAYGSSPGRSFTTPAFADARAIGISETSGQVIGVVLTVALALHRPRHGSAGRSRLQEE